MTVSAQGSTSHTQASIAVSASARPYVPPPLPQNSAPPVQSASFYRPPTTTIRSSHQLNRPAYLNPALTPSFTPPPPPPPQFWNYDAVPLISSAPLPPTYPPPPPRPPIEPLEVGKEALPPNKQLHSGGVGKKRKKKKNKMEKSNETQKAFATPAGAANNVSTVSICFHKVLLKADSSADTATVFHRSVSFSQVDHCYRPTGSDHVNSNEKHSAGQP